MNEVSKKPESGNSLLFQPTFQRNCLNSCNIHSKNEASTAALPLGNEQAPRNKFQSIPMAPNLSSRRVPDTHNSLNLAQNTDNNPLLHKADILRLLSPATRRGDKGPNFNIPNYVAETPLKFHKNGEDILQKTRNKRSPTFGTNLRANQQMKYPFYPFEGNRDTERNLPATNKQSENTNHHDQVKLNDSNQAASDLHSMHYSKNFSSSVELKMNQDFNVWILGKTSY